MRRQMKMPRLLNFFHRNIITKFLKRVEKLNAGEKVQICSIELFNKDGGF